MTPAIEREISRLVQAEMDAGSPSSQQECCDMAARVAYAAGAHRPEDDMAFMAAAKGMAIGLFGDAWDRAGEHQRALWLAMCEQALRTQAKPISA